MTDDLEINPWDMWRVGMIPLEDLIHGTSTIVRFKRDGEDRTVKATLDHRGFWRPMHPTGHELYLHRDDWNYDTTLGPDPIETLMALAEELDEMGHL